MERKLNLPGNLNLFTFSGHLKFAGNLNLLYFVHEPFQFGRKIRTCWLFTLADFSIFFVKNRLNWLNWLWQIEFSKYFRSFIVSCKRKSSSSPNRLWIRCVDASILMMKSWHWAVSRIMSMKSRDAADFYWSVVEHPITQPLLAEHFWKNWLNCQLCWIWLRISWIVKLPFSGKV